MNIFLTCQSFVIGQLYNKIIKSRTIFKSWLILKFVYDYDALNQYQKFLRTSFRDLNTKSCLISTSYLHYSLHESFCKGSFYSQEVHHIIPFGLQICILKTMIFLYFSYHRRSIEKTFNSITQNKTQISIFSCNYFQVKIIINNLTLEAINDH